MSNRCFGKKGLSLPELLLQLELDRMETFLALAKSAITTQTMHDYRDLYIRAQANAIGWAGR